MTQQTRTVPDEEVLGECPECGRVSGFRNVGRDHWGFCTDHKTAWWIGSNLFSNWQLETEEIWKDNIRFLDFFEVQPVPGASQAKVPELHKPGGNNENGSEDGEETKTGCAVCDPALQRHITETRTAHEAACRESLHIAQLGDGYHILEVPGPDGKPFRPWPGPFETQEAASLFLDSLVAAALDGNPNNACCSGGIVEYFNLAGRILAWLNSDDEKDRNLACKLATERPWERQKPQETFDELPF